jgi:hypothetical protein
VHVSFDKSEGPVFDTIILLSTVSTNTGRTSQCHGHLFVVWVVGWLHKRSVGLAIDCAAFTECCSGGGSGLAFPKPDKGKRRKKEDGHQNDWHQDGGDVGAVFL